MTDDHGPDPWIRSELESIDPPPEREGFWEEIRAALARGEAARARRWRRTSIALAIVAAGVATALGIVAAKPATAGFAGVSGNVLDRTLVCTAAPQGESTTVALSAGKTVELTIGDKMQLLAFGASHSGFLLDHSVCRPATERPLSLSVSVSGVFPPRAVSPLNVVCSQVDRFELHARITFSRSGTPLHAVIEIVREETAAPLMYVDWRPVVLRAAVASECQKR